MYFDDIEITLEFFLQSSYYIQVMLNYGLEKILVNRILNNKARMFLGSFVDSNNSKVTLAKLKFHNIAVLCKPISVIIPVILLCLQSKTSPYGLF